MNHSLRKDLLPALATLGLLVGLQACSQPARYAWEEREELATTTDAVLCYGASHHRNPFLWTKERFAPYVSYVDPQGQEHWLFDGFYFLESQDVARPDKKAYSFMTGVLRDEGVSAGKEQWQELIDYYFAEGNCVDALEEAVKEAETRLGKAPTKRRVIMMIPDPIIHQECIDVSTPTDYWGELNGRKMDFAKAEDRIAVYKWYINEVRKRFDQADYRYIELAGFYILSEELGYPFLYHGLAVAARNGRHLCPALPSVLGRILLQSLQSVIHIPYRSPFESFIFRPALAQYEMPHTTAIQPLHIVMPVIVLPLKGVEDSLGRAGHTAAVHRYNHTAKL